MAGRRGRPPGTEGAATRDRMREVALELFALKGFHATTVRQIASAVGVSDSAIYAHFSGKQAIYDEIFAEAGPPSFAALQVDVDTLVAAGPHQGLRYLVDRLFETWSTRRARLFANVVIREGAGTGGLTGLGEAIEAARERLEEPFRRWQEAGLVRRDVPAGQLVWELIGPLQVSRFVYLRAENGEEEVALARRWVDDHLAFFLTCTTTKGR